MKNSVSIIKELESYKYDVQYFMEKSKDIEKLKKEIEKSYTRLVEMQDKKIDTTELNKQLEKIIDKQTLEEEALLNILTKKQKIEKQIDSLPQPYKNVFFLRYISGNSFDEIALKMSYSTKRIYQLHKEGIKIYISLFESNTSVPIISTN